MRNRLQKIITMMVAVAGSMVLSVGAFAANGADPNGSMPFAADSTGSGVSFSINNGDFNPAFSETEMYKENKIKTFTTEANLRFNGYTGVNYFQNTSYNDGTYKDKDGNSYPAGYDFKYPDTIIVNANTKPITAETGYHLYDYHKVDGKVTIAYWTLHNNTPYCIHGDGIDENWHGLKYTEGALSNNGYGYVIHKCGELYRHITRGWKWTCADCGQERNALHYMTPKTASNFTSVDASYAYYYVCPFQGNMENAFWEDHWCKDISPNKYTVSYKGNGGIGFISPSIHLYNNDDYTGTGNYTGIYDGREQVAKTNLNINAFKRTGYIFTGWNTEPDGSGIAYEDGQEILNLTNIDGGRITLYAQWQKKDDYLTVTADDGHGHVGTYDEVTSKKYTVPYNDTITIDESKAKAPIGYQVQFDTDGGTITRINNTGLINVSGTTGYTTVKVNPIEAWDYSKFDICNWSRKTNIENGIVTITNNNSGGKENPIVRVTYSDQPFTMPYATKTGKAFVGWEITSVDTEITYAGGESIYPSNSISNSSNIITFKALYGDMSATVTPDYQLTTQDGNGAVDIEWDWTQSSKFPLYYKVYEGDEYGKNLKQINLDDSFKKEEINTGVKNKSENGIFTVTTPGRYTITASGAKGSSTGNNVGGSGRTVSVQLTLNEGDQIIYEKINGGTSSATDAGPGGAGELVYLQRSGSEEKTVILIAGGGGSATVDKNGGSASSTLTTTLENGPYTGQNGQYGGGAGNKPGAAGQYDVTINTGHFQEFYYETPQEGENNPAFQKFEAPISGTYQLEVWGAQGGSYISPDGKTNGYGGKGGYSKGNIKLNKGDVVYVVVGGCPGNSNPIGGYNGGATSTNAHEVDNGGGGATHIGTFENTLAGHGSTNGLYIVAGGGGGATHYNDGGHGGGENGENGETDDKGRYIGGGSQGGFNDSNVGYMYVLINGSLVYKKGVFEGTFGQGGQDPDSTDVQYSRGGGGGGYYGGSTFIYENTPTSATNLNLGGGGGSGYIGGVINGTGTTTVGQREGDGKAKITLLSIDEVDENFSDVISIAATGGTSYYDSTNTILISNEKNDNNTSSITITGYTYEKDIDTGVTKETTANRYRITTPGIYTITAIGAKGSSTSACSGGNGRSVSVKMWLNINDIIIYNFIKGGESTSTEAGGPGGDGVIVYYQSALNSAQRYTIAIAGGGGAATPLNSGEDALGVTAITHNASGSKGGSGEFGGGAGYKPGVAGTSVYHIHDASCYHVHTGSSTSGGGCYSDGTCNGKVTQTSSEQYGGEYDALSSSHTAYDSNGVLYCTRCGSSSSHTHSWYYGDDEWTCQSCGKKYSSSRSVCNASTYVLNCPYKDYASGEQVEGNLECGEDLISSSIAATGGSSVYNSNYVKLVSDKPSSDAMASVTITGKTTSMDFTTSLNNHCGDDKAAPATMTVSNNGVNKNTNVDLRFIDKETNMATISIAKPNDYGTSYTYFIEGYQVSDLTEMPYVTTTTWANPYPVNIKTGIAGYKIAIFDAEQKDLICTKGIWNINPKDEITLGTTVTSEAKEFGLHPQSIPNMTSDDEIIYEINLADKVQYVYISAYDFAENCSNPCLIKIPAKEESPSDDVPQKWEVYTNELKITPTYDKYKNVYGPISQTNVNGTSQLFDAYFVKADGQTPFKLTEKAYSSSKANVDMFYMNTVSYSIIPTTDNVLTENPSIQYQLQTNGLLRDSENSNETEIAKIKTPYFRPAYLQNITDPLYSRYLNKDLRYVSTDLSFTIDEGYSGIPLFVFPEATGYSIPLDETVYSNRSSDVKNGIVLIPDAEGPTITDTLNVLGNPNTQIQWDPNNVPEEIIFNIEDSLSGIAHDKDDNSYPNIKATISNPDSGNMPGIEYPIENILIPGTTNISIPIEKDNSVFAGTFTITVEAVDNVGNETKVEYEITNYTSDSYIEYVDMEPAKKTDEKYFATLDNGKIHVIMTGYVDDVIITASEIITFKDSGNNVVNISYNGNSTADVIGSDFPLYKTDTEIPFIVSGKLDEDKILSFRIDAIKDGETKTTYLYGKYKQDKLSIKQNGIYSLETTEGIPNIYRVPTSYKNLLSGMLVGENGNSYFVKANTSFETQHITENIIPTREDAVFDKMYMTVKNITDDSSNSVYCNNTSLETYILNNAPNYIYRYFKYNESLKNAFSFNTEAHDIISAQNTEKPISIENGQSFEVINYIQRVDSKLTWSVPSFSHGDVIRIMPRATLAYEQNKILECADTGDILKEALYVIPDAKGPVVGGADELDQAVVYPGKIQAVNFTFTDSESGYHHAEIFIENISTNESDYYYTTSQNKQVIIDTLQDLWLGVIKIKVVAYDNVGNVTTNNYTVFSLGLEGVITNVHEPYTNVFYSGNRGWLFIESIGYIDSIDVVFPDDIIPSYWVYQDGDYYGLYEYEKDASGNRLLDANGNPIFIKNYTSLDDKGNPQLPQSFTIPLNEGPGYDHNSPKRLDLIEFKIADKRDLDEVYKITVTGHKGTSIITDEPFLVIAGYSSDLWRTRLR